MLRLARNFTTIFAVLAISLSTVIVARPPATIAESAGPRIIETTAKSIVFELDVPQPVIDQVEVDGRVFDRVTLPGYASTGLPGHPELPQIGVSLGIPAEGEVIVKVLDAKEEDLPGTYTVLPASAWTVQRDPQTGQAVAEAGVQAEFALDDGHLCAGQLYTYRASNPRRNSLCSPAADCSRNSAASPCQPRARPDQSVPVSPQLKYPSRQSSPPPRSPHPLPSRMLLTPFYGINFSTLNRRANGRCLARQRSWQHPQRHNIQVTPLDHGLKHKCASVACIR